MVIFMFQENDNNFPKSACIPNRKVLEAVSHAADRRGDRKWQALVAQLDRAPDYESGGQEFESLRARHFFTHEKLEYLSAERGVLTHSRRGALSARSTLLPARPPS
tara:strand:+ start:141 stop:458 length:318 start_codon:yes stop_codon:yes gene_type:complete